MEDFDRWAASWKDGSDNVKDFQEMGVTARIFQSTDEKQPEKVNILFDIADMEAWSAYQGTDEMRANAKMHGVIFDNIQVYQEK